MIQVYSLMHVASGFLLVALTFAAFAAPTPERKRCSLILGGILSLSMLTGGFGLMAQMKYSFAPWLYIKIACWLALSAMAGIAFKRPQLAGKLTLLTTLLVLAALWSVYYKPGMSGIAA